jgi:hypothetical protein
MEDSKGTVRSDDPGPAREPGRKEESGSIAVNEAGDFYRNGKEWRNDTVTKK